MKMFKHKKNWKNSTVNTYMYMYYLDSTVNILLCEYVCVEVSCRHLKTFNPSTWSCISESKDFFFNHLMSSLYLKFPSCPKEPLKLFFLHQDSWFKHCVSSISLVASSRHQFLTCSFSFPWPWLFDEAFLFWVFLFPCGWSQIFWE